MQAFMPMLIVRTHMATAAVEMNGTLIGEASPDSHLAVPLSDSGEYYIGIYPLEDRAERYFPVVRKLSFLKGKLQPVESGDVEAYAWPDGVFEAVFTPGVIPLPNDSSFPFTIDHMRLGSDRFATLYYDGGLKLAVEEGPRVRYGTSLNGAHTGRLILQKNGLLIALAGEPAITQNEALEGFSRMAVVLDGGFNEILRLSCDAVGIRNEDELICFTRFPSSRKHEQKQIYRFIDGAYEPQPPDIGFFLHSPQEPSQGTQLIHAFCDAVRYELWDEALGYLTPSLREGLGIDIIRECMGDFIGIRPPLTRQNSAIGLLYKQEGGIAPIRMFSFSFDGGLIDNILED